MQLTLDTLVAGGQFNGQVPVVGGVQWALTDLTGWWGSPATRTARTDRRGAAGSFRRAAYKDVRDIEITVTATAVDFSRTAMRQAERTVAAVCSDPGALYQLRVEDELGVLVAYVELNGDVAWKTRDGLRYSSIFSIPVCALDPRRLGPSWSSTTTPVASSGSGGIVTTGGGIVTTSPGISTGTPAVIPSTTAAAVGTSKQVPLVFEIDGPGQDLVVTDSRGPLVSYRGTLGAGDTVWINADSQDAYDVPGAPGPIAGHGAVLNGGGDARSAVSVRGGWPVLAGGASASFTLGGTSTTGAQLTVHTRPAYT